jgi:hypothetical protein
MIYVFCRNAQSESHRDPHDICMLSLFYQLPNCNFPTCCYLSYGETPLVNYGPRANFLYIAITILLLLALFTFLHTITFYHSIRSILCLQLIGEIDNLIISWGKVLGCVVYRFHIAAGSKQSPGRGAL